MYSYKGTLFAIPFDADRLETYGTAVPVVDGVTYAGLNNPAEFDVSRNGTLVYRTGSGADLGMTTVQWLDRTGKREPLWTKAGAYSTLRFSPDGTRFLVAIFEQGNRDIWIYDWQRGTMTRLTFGEETYETPLWSPDGRYIIFGSLNHGMFWTRADGSGQPQPFTKSTNTQMPWSFAPDGKRLAYTELNPASNLAFNQIWTVPVEDDRGQLRADKPEPFLKTAFDNLSPTFSPDGRWLAYSSNESGRAEVYVRPFPPPVAGPGGKGQVSNTGGQAPLWARNGRELLYRAGDQIMEVGYTIQHGSFAADKPRVWANAGSTPNPYFDLTPDGTRVAVLMPVETPSAPTVDHEVVFLLNFFDELRRRVPVSRR
jgi:serine/threonine-protein kinase